ncbi:MULTISPECIES: catalase [Oerskovia]|uniref:Catalase n=2 Tax=Oerskovia TaxID=162491 RepID=A0ABR8UWU9_9CELL|nr:MULTISPECIES: catalase [Oerskovia]MBD7997003.1 catalase [Oerskovia gallyi]MBM7498117.1 catalase [Oerskovia paurometabola]
MSARRTPDQEPPADVSPTGVPADQKDPDPRAQQGDRLTTAQGLRVHDTDHSLKAGPRGPVLLEDHHLREKITHFDHERIPERVVHARGAAAHGVFTSYGNASAITKAGFLSQEGKETEVFVRFSTVAGSRGSADTVRDVRGFSTKFYTDEGVYDLVGNVIPVFFVQDAIKFPDLIHAVKPHPDREIPQAQSAHDTFWDFVSRHTEAQHTTMWVMSPRGLAASYRTTEGFGVHTFRMENAAGETSLVKLHWKPVAGVHNMVWEEAQLAAGFDPDFHRRDLADAIEAGAFPEWELGLQVMPDTPDEMFMGIDLLDPTKIVPEELCPVQKVGRLRLTANPSNYFAETEQVAFHPGHLVPGIQITNDPLLQGRLFSYLDTQLSRLGGPNFAQLPINRPHAPVDDMLRDGMHQTAVHEGLGTYQPNTMADGLPAVCPVSDPGVYVTLPTPVSGEKVRENPVSFADHFTQPRMFWNSLTPIEQTQTVAAYTFELGKCQDEQVRVHQLRALAKIDADLVARVAAGLGLPVPEGEPGDGRDGAGEGPGAGESDGITRSAAISEVSDVPGPIAGRNVGVFVGEDLVDGLRAVRERIGAEQALVKVVAARGGVVGSGADEQKVDRTAATVRSIELDAVVVADGMAGSALGTHPRTRTVLEEAFRHGKAIAAWGDGVDVLVAAGIDTEAEGVLTADELSDGLLDDLVDAVGLHRAWGRLSALDAAGTQAW